MIDRILEFLVFVLGAATILCGTVLMLFMTGYFISWVLT